MKFSYIELHRRFDMIREQNPGLSTTQLETKYLEARKAYINEISAWNRAHAQWILDTAK
jgi:hypothetical protein